MRYILAALTAIWTLPLSAEVTTFRDAVRALGHGREGITVAKELVGVANLMSERLAYDGEAKDFFNFLNDALEDFDFARIHDSNFLRTQADGFRSIVLSGKQEPGAYRVTLSPQTVDRAALGNTRAEYRMRRNQSENQKTYTTQVSLETALKKFDGQAAARLLETLLKVHDPINILRLKAPQAAAFSELQGASRNIANQAAADFPNASAMVSKYLELRSYVEPKMAGRRPYTQVALRGHFRMQALAADYPRFHKFMKHIRNLFIFQLYAADKKGQNLLSFIINAQSEEFYIGFKTAGGKILPMQKDGTPAFADAISLSGKVDHKFFLALNFFVNVYGLKIHTGNIGAYLRYQANAQKMSFFSKVTSVPEGKISGALFGVLPTWVIDLSIPSDLQTLMNQFSQVMLKANNGEGSRAEIAWIKRGGNAALTASMSTEFLDNRFIRIGMKIWVRKFRPSNSVQDDIRLFIGRFTRAVLTDLAAM